MMSNGTYTGLLKSLSFRSFLWTQSLGAFNDNYFKGIISMFAVNLAAQSGNGGLYVSLVGAVFNLAFFLFSGYAGYLSDAYNKRSVLIVTKSFEIIAALSGFFALWSGRIELMLVTLFLMSTHSTFFGPAKYGIVPEMLPDKDLSRANGLLEMTTYIAITLGSFIGVAMYSQWKGSLYVTGFFLLAIACTGTLSSFGVARVQNPGKRSAFKLNPWGEITWGLKRLYHDRFLMTTVAGITYFWFLGSLLHMDLLLLGKEVMGLSEIWIGILYTCLAVGIGIGSVVAGKLSGDKVEPGLVPLGSIGMGVFSVLLAFFSPSFPRTAVSLMLLGFSGGLFIVPLNALLQQKSGEDEKGRLIGTNNFLNTAGMLLSSGVLWIMRDHLGFTADRIIFVFGIITLVCTVFMMKALPEFLMRFTLWMLTHTLYKIKLVGQENVPFKGPALLVCNHMSFVDGFLVGACVQRFIRFMVYDYFYNLRAVKWLMVLMKAIPVADGNRREIIKTLQRARQELIDGHLVCIFAEGAISRTGNLLPFKRGLEKVVEGLNVPVIPVHLDRVWGSVFSFKKGLFFWKLPHHFPYPVTVSFGKPLPSSTNAEEVRSSVMELASHAMEYRGTKNDLLHLKFIRTAKRHLFSPCMADTTGKRLTWGNALTGSMLFSRWIKENCPSEMVGILLPATVGGALLNSACVMAGKVPVNLNFTAPRADIDYAVAKCSIKTIITSRAVIEKAGLEKDGSMVFIEDIAPILKGRKRAAIAAYTFPGALINRLYCAGGITPRSLAAVIFTSGSTGRPKGVMLSHHNITSNIDGFTQIFNVSSDDTVVGVLPFFHAFGYTGTVWFPLTAGLKAVYHPNPMDGKTVGSIAKDFKATILIGTPTFYSSWMKKCGPDDFSTVRYAIAGAEKLKNSIAKEFRHKFGIDLLEGYGCTEMSPVISVNIPDVEHDNMRQTGFKAGTVGHPIPGVAVKVVDPETGADLPGGSEGLLLVKGPNMMQGYLGDPDLTAKAKYNGWYVTGDIASIGEDGFLRIVDRTARFTKIAGEMVPHGRIEEALSKVLHRGSDCAVISIPDEKRGERLLAFHTDGRLTGKQLRDALLAAGFPAVWTPRKEDFFHIDSIPVTATGKMDLRALKDRALRLMDERERLEEGIEASGALSSGQRG